MNFNHPVRELMWMVGGNIPLTLEQQNMHTARSNTNFIKKHTSI